MCTIKISAAEPESPVESTFVPETTKIEISTKDCTPEPETTSNVKNGFYQKNNQICYYKDGLLHKGFLEIGGKKYYFDSNGNMVIGNKKIGKNYYYFNSNGTMKTGFVKIKSKKYYYSKKTGKKLYGFRKIGKYRYYLNKKTGAVTTGFVTRNYKGSKIMTYYNSKGHLKTGTFKVSTVKYKATKKIGKIYSVKNLANAICQRPQLPTGCEITSWTMMANYAGIKMSKTKAANIMPKSSDPNRGFMGSPYTSGRRGLVVYPDGLKSITNKYFGNYTNLTNCSLSKLKSALRKKHLVMVWVTQLDGFASHTVVLTGYDKMGFFYNDPWTGTKRKISYQYFKTIWSANAHRAMSY